MKKSDINQMPPFFNRYINLVDDIELIDGLQNTLTLLDTEIENLIRVEDKKYAPEKWTTKEVIQHITDNERIQSCRAMRIARNDQTILPGYDEKVLGNNTNANQCDVVDLYEEFKLLRQSNIILFKNLNGEMLQREGTCFKVNITPLALGFVMVGHLMHHVDILKERYFTLI